MTIHSTDPFATPSERRSPLRQLRGRLASPVTLWTSGEPTERPPSHDWAGLTISSTLVVDGEPGRLLGLVDSDADLWHAIERTGRFTVAPLAAGDQQLADRFAGLMPAPGGLFRHGWTATPYGPVRSEGHTWAGCLLDSARPYGWALLVEATIDTVTVGPDAAPLLHYRGRYRRLHG